MEHLTALDAAFLEVEDSDPHVSLANGAVSIVEGPPPSHDEFVAVLTERAQSIPRCMQVLKTHPLDIGSPEWVDDPHFDASRHLHRLAVPHPGGDAELFDIVAEVMERRLDRERPLWDCFLIEGLSDDRWAVLTKLHHCIADGIATAQMMAQFSDEGGGESFATDNPRRQGAGAAVVGSDREPQSVDLGECCRAQCRRRGVRRRTRRVRRGRADGGHAHPGAGDVIERPGNHAAAIPCRPGQARRSARGR